MCVMGICTPPSPLVDLVALSGVRSDQGRKDHSSDHPFQRLALDANYFRTSPEMYFRISTDQLADHINEVDARDDDV
jgi:hypothetical protein